MLLPDINVWMALANSAHVHHVPAKAWFDSLDLEEELVFCRFTQLGLLRLLTQTAAMGNRVKTQRQAWLIYDRFMAAGHMLLAQEPRSLDENFRRLASLDSVSPRDWADSYLAAFTDAGGITLITFDKALAQKARNAKLLSAEFLQN